jgi:hypothetical protein
MAQPKKKLKIWRVLILRERARYLGTVKAPDERAAAAIAQFKLDDDPAQAAGREEQEHTDGRSVD